MAEKDERGVALDGVPYDEEAAANMVAPPVVPLPVIEGDHVWVSAIVGKVGTSGRWVGVGDLLTEAEAGNGVSHGTAYKLPAFRGVVGLMRAAFARSRALEALILSGDDELLRTERERILEIRRRITPDEELIAEAVRRGYEVTK